MRRARAGWRSARGGPAFARRAVTAALLFALSVAVLTVCGPLLAAAVPGAAPVRIGSKKFTESYVLGEIAVRLVRERTGARVEHRAGMGGTVLLWQALRTGAIDAYPEYTGTISEEILKRPGNADAAALRAALAPLGIGMTEELGFNNTYALVMRADRALALGITRIGDLATHPELVAGITPEFLGRQDGWAPLLKSYGLRFADVRALEHGLGYAALRTGAIDLKECYSTDARIAEDSFQVLEDERAYFPAYRAVFLYRLDMDPDALRALRRLEGTLDEARMTALNAHAERTRDYAAAAGLWFGGQGAAPGSTAGSTARGGALLRATRQHVTLVGLSLLAAVLVGLPLGIRAARGDALAQLVLGAVGLIQTIPSLALLAFLIPLVGIGAPNAILALFLYSLLPIVRNTAAGLADIPGPLREAAIALGLSPGTRLRRVELPLATRAILAGIKTSAVINVGTATLAGLIGGGGYGEAIQSGLQLNDIPTILSGAIPAAVLALLVQGGFDLIERFLIPPALRSGPVRMETLPGGRLL